MGGFQGLNPHTTLECPPPPEPLLSLPPPPEASNRGFSLTILLRGEEVGGGHRAGFLVGEPLSPPLGGWVRWGGVELAMMLVAALRANQENRGPRPAGW